MTATGVLWLGLLEGPSGYADEARGFLRVLEDAGFAPAAREALRDGGDARLSPGERRALTRQLGRSERDAEVAVHHYAPAWMREAPTLRGMANVARTMFETDGLPPAWLGQLLRRDEVWVPSEHGREAFERGGIPSGRLRVVGGTLDFELFSPTAEPLALDVPEGHLVFLSNFAFSERKAWRELLHGWALAFAPTDPVCLVLKTTAGKDEAALRARVAAALADAARAAGRDATAPVVLRTDTLGPRELAGLYAACDAYVLASRGEGWGRPYMEAMAVGLPTIASRWSGNLAFMSDETSWLVDGELMPVPDEHGTFADRVPGQRWFAPDVAALAGCLAQVAGDPGAARERAARARPDLLARFGPEATTATLGAALEDVAGRERRLPRTGRAVRIRGGFGRHASLALVNDRLLAGLEAGGRRVDARAIGTPAEPGTDIVISHSWPPDLEPGSEGPSVAILPWEFGAPPREWLDRVRAGVDRVVVPSDYVRDGYVAAGMPPGSVEVVPNGIDPGAFSPDGPARELPRTAGCTFLYVGGTIWRKGIDLLLEGWLRAFGPDDDVQLVIKDHGGDGAYRGQTSAAAIRSVAERPGAAPVVHLTDHLPADALPALYRAADVLVAPYRGEGFALPILEAMACGLPPIHTAEGPSREFAGPGTGWAVPARRGGLAGRRGLPELAGDGFVHEVDVDALAHALREAAADPAERRRRGAAAVAAAGRFTWDAAAQRLERVLAELEAEGLPPARTLAPVALDARPCAVLYAPDWSDEEAWAATVVAWSRAVAPDAPVSLVLPVEEAQAGDVVARLLARLGAEGLAEDDLPDLVLHQGPAGDLLALVAAADAVLLDDRQAAAAAPVLWRRARRVLTTDGLDAFAAEHRAGVAAVAADA